MAKKEIDKLYVSIGVNTDDLKVGFEKSDQTINQYVSKLNQQAKNIKLKADIDLSKLELSGNALDKLRVKAKALQAELDIAKQKQSISAQTLALNSQKYGADSAITRKSQTIDLYRQKDVANLENELAKVNKELDKINPKSSSAFSKLSTNAKQAAGSMGGLTASITSLNAKWTAVLAVIGTGAGFLNLTESAMKAGEQLYQIQNRLKITAQEAGQLKKVFSMSDSDVMSLPSFIARLDKSYTQAGESGKNFRETLEAYGIVLTDSNGKLLGTTQQLEQLAKGLENARKSGDEESFSMDVLGARGQQLMPVLDQFATKMDLIRKTGSTGLLDAKEAHDLYLRFQQLQLQVGDLKGAIGKALLPIAEEMMPSLIEITKEFCNVIKDNKDSIRDAVEGWGSVFKELAETVGKTAAATGDLIKVINDTDTQKSKKQDEEILKQMYGNEAVEKGRTWATILGGGAAAVGGGILGGPVGAGVGFLSGAEVANELYTEFGKTISRGTEWEYYKKALEANPEYFRMKDELEAQEQNQRKKTTEIIKKEKEELQKATGATKENTDATKANGEAQKLTASQTKERNAATKELKKELQELTSSDYDNKLAALQKKIDEFKEKHVDDKLIKEYYNASLKKINKNVSEGVFEPMSKAFKTDFQNSLDDVDAQAKRFKEQAGSALTDDKLESWVQKRKSQITADWDRQVAEQIDSIWNTEFTNQLNRIEREKQAWIQKGLDEVKATKWAEEQKKQVQNDSIKAMFTQQKKYLDIYRQAMRGQINPGDGWGIYDFTQSPEDKQKRAILAIQRQMMKDAGVNPNERTTLEEVQGFQAAMKSANNWGLSLLKDGKNLSLADSIIPWGDEHINILNDINTEIPQINTNLSSILEAIRVTKDPLQGTTQNISVNPSINVNLSGAYVFNDEARARLADDVTKNVTNAITEAVKTATNSPNIGFAS